MIGLVEYIARSLVDDPDAVRVTETEDRNSINIQLSVAEDDMGKIIGKKGRIARSIRTVVRAAAARNNKRITVKIVQ